MKSILLWRANRSLPNQEAYLQKKYTRFYAGIDAPPENGVATVGEPPPIALTKDHPVLPDVLISKIKLGWDCVLKDINHRFLLDEGEKVKEDSFSYLSKPFQSCPADTVVLTRTTTLSEFYIIFPDLKTESLSDDKSGGTFFSVHDKGQPLYPIPPCASVKLNPQLKVASTGVASAGYTITSLKVVSSTQIQFGWSFTELPGNMWWAVYPGVMPSWKNLGQYNNWDYINPKNSGNDKKSGQQTVTVSAMSSGAIYTFAIFKWKWDVVDYQQFNA